MKTEMTDRQLVTLVLGGKTQACSDIVSRHSALVFAKAMGVVRCRDLAAEIAQQTFVRAYTRLADWHGDDSIAPWLAMIAVRLSLTHLDTARRRRAGQLDHDVPYEDYSPEHERRLQRMEQAVSQLGEPDRSIVQLHYYRHQTTAEIAARLSLTQANVLVRLNRIRQRLKKQLEHGEDE